MIYVASSWRNNIQPYIVRILRAEGHNVYDFKDENGFHWSDIDPTWKSWTPEEYRDNLKSKAAVGGFNRDMDAMIESDTFVGVQPFGRSASMEMGWAAGNGKKTILLLENGEPELMVKMFDHICLDIDEVIWLLEMI